MSSKSKKARAKKTVKNVLIVGAEFLINSTTISTTGVPTPGLGKTIVDVCWDGCESLFKGKDDPFPDGSLSLFLQLKEFVALLCIFYNYAKRLPSQDPIRARMSALISDLCFSVYFVLDKRVGDVTTESEYLLNAAMKESEDESDTSTQPEFDQDVEKKRRFLDKFNFRTYKTLGVRVGLEDENNVKELLMEYDYQGYNVTPSGIGESLYYLKEPLLVVAKKAAADANQFYSLFEGKVQFKSAPPGELNIGKKTMRRCDKYQQFKGKARRNLDSILTLMKCCSILRHTYGVFPSVDDENLHNYSKYFELLWKVNKNTNPFKKANVSVVDGVASSKADREEYPKNTKPELKDMWPLHIQLARRSADSSGIILFQKEVEILSELTDTHLYEKVGENTWDKSAQE